MDYRVATVFREFPQQEKVSFVAVITRTPLLPQPYAVFRWVNLRAGYTCTAASSAIIAYLAEFNVNPFVAVKSFF